jgi:hypothetical protein
MTVKRLNFLRTEINLKTAVIPAVVITLILAAVVILIIINK